MTSPAFPTLSKWRSLEIALLRIYDGDLRPGANYTRADQHVQLRKHANTNLRAWLIREGKCNVGVNDVRHLILPGHWFFPPREVSWQRFSADTSLLSITFRANWPDGKALFDSGEGIDVQAGGHPALEAAANEVKKIVDGSLGSSTWFLDGESLELDSFLSLNQALHSWLLALSRCLKTLDIHPTRTEYRDERIESALQWLHGMPLNQKFREHQLAQYFGLSVVHLNRLFSKEVGMSPVDILERRRWERAVNLLEFSEVPIKQLSYDLGFSSPSHFTAWFKSKAGETPREYRKH